MYGSLSCRRRRRRADVDARIYLFRDNRIEDKTIHVMRLVSIIISVMHRRGITSARRLLDQEGAERRRSAFDHHADAASFRVVIHRLRYSRPRFHVIMTHQRSRVIEPEDAPTTTTTGARLNGKQHSRFHDTLSVSLSSTKLLFLRRQWSCQRGE